METSVNNKCRAFTSLEQSKKLAEILPLESADMYYGYGKDKPEFLPISDVDVKCLSQPCWSLAALLDFLPNNYIDLDDAVKKPSLIKTRNGRYMVIYSAFQYTSLCDNPIDACYEMILKLHELDLV